MSEYPTISKRQKLIEQQPLLPGLPDHIAHLCLSNVHPSFLYHVCNSWRRLIYSPSFPPFLSLYTTLSSISDHSIHFFTFDPISFKWDPLPSPPPEPPLDLLLYHPSFLSRKLPVQSVSVSGKLILLAATDHNFDPALTRPLIFDPITRDWTFGPPLATPRRWCAAGALRNVVYVTSGIGSQFSVDVAKSVEKWHLEEYKPNTSKRRTNKKYCSKLWRWEKMRELKDGRFSREAINAVGWRGKLCMVNVTAKEGVFYDVVKDKWEDMPEGMIKGWRGPVAAMDEEVMYMVDENDGTLRKYNQETDIWTGVIKSELLKGAQCIAAGGGRVCVVCKGDGGGIVVVNVMASPPTLWIVDTPPGYQALTVHILPRLISPVSDFRY